MRMKMKTDATYLALSKNKNLHFEMNLEDYAQCRGQFIRICPFNAPIYRRHNVNTCLYANYIGDHDKMKENCEIILSKRNNAEWIKIDNSDMWFHDVQREELNLVCMGETPRHLAVVGAGNITIKAACEIHSENYMLIQNIIGSSAGHELEIGVLDKNMISFLENLANFTVSSVVTIEENRVLDNILTTPGWDIDFAKGVKISELKKYMERLEFQDKINNTNYRVVALYAILIIIIVLYLGYLSYCYLSTMECTFRRKRGPLRVPPNSIDSFDGNEPHYELEFRD